MAEDLLQTGAHFGNYTVQRLLGRGGMGEVYLVEDPVSRDLFAVKVLLTPEDDAAAEERVDRFIHEAETAMNLSHPNLVSVYDAGKDPDTGLCYMTMEYLPHGSLKDRLAAQGALGFSEVASIAADMAAALAVIEQAGLVHRDVKPANIMFAADGTAKLADLGISRFTDFKVDSRRTDAGDVVGTPAYMAPEQMLDSRAVDIRADIYSLGVVMWEMLAGKRPNEGESAMTTLARALEHLAPPDVRDARQDCPEPLASLVSAMMMPEAAQRPADAKTVLWMLANPQSIGGRSDAAVQPLPWYCDRATLYALVALIFSLEVLIVAIITVARRF